MTTPSTQQKPIRKKEFFLFRWLRSFFYFILELFIPLVISIGLVYIFGNLVNFGKLKPEIIGYIFAAALVAFSFLLSTSIDRFTYLLRGTVLEEEEANAKTRRKKTIKVFLSGILLPLGLAAAMVFIRTTLTGETYMQMLVRAVVRHGETTVVVDIGNTVAASASYETKIQGIKALATIHTPETLEQLLYILEHDPTVLENQSLYLVLSEAIASYGADGQSRLLDIYNKAVKEGEEGTTDKLISQEDYYTRYFADAFAALQKELSRQTGDPQQQRQQQLLIEQAQAQLKTTLNALNPVLVTGSRQDLLLSFVMDTTIAMNVQQDEKLYPLVKKIAGDPAQPEILRGKAIVLVGRLGSQADFKILYEWMNDPSEYIRSKTLYAVDQLYRKVNNLPIQDKK